MSLGITSLTVFPPVVYESILGLWGILLLGPGPEFFNHLKYCFIFSLFLSGKLQSVILKVYKDSMSYIFLLVLKILSLHGIESFDLFGILSFC